MSLTVERQAAWKLNGSVAVCSGAEFSGELDVSRPHIGIAFNLRQTAPSAAHILGVRPCFDEERGDATGRKASAWPLRTADVYIRGNDLVATYEAAAEWPFSPQLYWQADTLRNVDGVHASLSVLVSVQTQLLDTFPRVGAASQLPPGEVVALSLHDAGGVRTERVEDHYQMQAPAEIVCVLARLKDSTLTYAEIAAPSDFHELSIRSAESGASTEWQLFSEFLEKGVIRRARVHAVLLPRDRDVELARRCCDAIQRLQLPLTT